MGTTTVWYAAYGSNCDDDRFGCYLAGGRPHGSTRQHVGCRDTTPPTGAAVGVLPHKLYFGGWSPYWQGAVAFVDPRPDADAGTLSVLRRITVDQFADVVAQECGDLDLPGGVPLDEVVATGRVDLPGHYGTVLAAGQRDGDPIVTCTSAIPRERGRPARAYLDTIRRGLGRFHPGERLDAYLARLVDTGPAVA